MNMKSYTTPNCDCGAELRRGWGKICSRCGCLNCSGCSDKINGKWVGQCCQHTKMKGEDDEIIQSKAKGYATQNRI